MVSERSARRGRELFVFLVGWLTVCKYLVFSLFVALGFVTASETLRLAVCYYSHLSSPRAFATCLSRGLFSA